MRTAAIVSDREPAPEPHEGGRTTAGADGPPRGCRPQIRERRAQRPAHGLTLHRAPHTRELDAHLRLRLNQSPRLTGRPRSRPPPPAGIPPAPSRPPPTVDALCRLRDELLIAEPYGDLRQDNVVTAAWHSEYKHSRPHSTLGYQTPAVLSAMRSAGRSLGGSAPNPSRKH
jgi:hypothetical protein